ncbi:MAG: hypothetical protein ACK551_05995 [Vampirovibrionales bacterium]
MKLMARSPSPTSFSPPSPQSVDTARQRLGSLTEKIDIELFYHPQATFPEISALCNLTGAVIRQVPEQVQQLTQIIRDPNANSDVPNALLSYIHLFTSALTGGIRDSLESRWGNQWRQAFDGLIKQEPDLLGLNLVAQSTDLTREATLFISPSSEIINTDLFEGIPPALQLSAELAHQTNSKALTLQGTMVAPNENSVDFLNAIRSALTGHTQSVAIELNQPR